MEGFLALVMFLVMVGFYIAPAVVAYLTHRQHFAVIAAITITLGWTVVGWIGALIWACVDREKPAPAPTPWSAL